METFQTFERARDAVREITPPFQVEDYSANSGQDATFVSRFTEDTITITHDRKLGGWVVVR